MPPISILIAPNALKGSLSAKQAAAAMAHGIQRAWPSAHLQLAPLADGGDGWLEVLREALAVETYTYPVSGPLKQKLNAELLYDAKEKRAFIELAKTAGLALLTTEQYDPLRASTRGVGELILAALDLGARQVILGIGGSASNDGGIGMAHALGVVFKDTAGHSLPPLAQHLEAIHSIDFSHLDPRVPTTVFEVCCDVDNPLLGSRGATQVFGPQKGAQSHVLEQLESGLRNLAHCWQQQLGMDLRALPGAGAAGGFGAGAVAFLGAQLSPGTALIFRLLDLETKLQQSDLVVTAEGCLDQQTAQGKAPAALAIAAQKHGVPCIAVVGEWENNVLSVPLTACFSLCPGPIERHVAMQGAAAFLSQSSEQIVRCFLAGYQARSKTEHRKSEVP